LSGFGSTLRLAHAASGLRGPDGGDRDRDPELPTSRLHRGDCLYTPTAESKAVLDEAGATDGAAISVSFRTQVETDQPLW